ncbi:MAG TPA: hypothetical protein VN031_01350 [Candidatus Microsaccharimonas sp.]|nr:hypothetical protein [Candidatus Microsaccharimonas sp.]
MTHIIGLVSSTGGGIDMDLFMHASHSTPPTETIALKDGYSLDIIDVPVRNRAYTDRAVGYASLHPGLVGGEYEAYYGLNADLEGKSIVSNSMRAVLRRVLEQDIHFGAAKFLISATNERSMNVARSLGAESGRQLGVFMMFSLTAEQFMAKQAQGATDGR